MGDGYIEPNCGSTRISLLLMSFAELTSTAFPTSKDGARFTFSNPQGTSICAIFPNKMLMLRSSGC